MDLDFSEEQEVLRAMVRSLCEEACPLEVVREMEDDPRGWPEPLWKKIGELGLLGLRIPEAYGGAGQGLLDTVVVYEEFGRALAPVPAFHSGIVSAALLSALGDDAQREAWLPRIASGDAILTPAWLEPDGGFGPRGVQLVAERSGGAWKLRGAKRHVHWARSAARLLVLARTGTADTDLSLFLVDPLAPGVQLVQCKSLAGDTQYDVAFEDATAEPLGAAGAGWGAWDDAMHEAVIVLAATAIGGCERAHEITTQYAKDRKQFGKPLGAFQAISHYLADALTRIDGGRVLVYEAAWNADRGRDIGRLAPMAKLFACDTFRDTTAMCQQVWGGVGFTVEYDIQLFFRRAKQLQITWWDGATLEERIASHVLDRGRAAAARVPSRTS